MQLNSKANAEGGGLLGSIGSADVNVNVKITPWTFVGIAICCLVIFFGYFSVKKQLS